MVSKTVLRHWAAAALVAAAVAVAGTGCVWGVVRDSETGGALPGASVSYVDSYGNTASTTTDANGIYVFDQSRGPVPAMGPVTFQVEAAGYGTFTESREAAYDDGPQPTLSNLSSFWEVQSFGLTVSPSSPDGGQPTLGPVNAPVRIVEFADFQCPYCRRFAEDTLPQIIANYGDRVFFVFRNFPLTSIHAYAYKAAEAAECAHQQGAFWQYHDMLFANQAALGVDGLKRYALATGLDMADFNDCLDSGETAPAVDADLAAGQQAASQAGLTQFGTPAFFINGEPLIGAYPYDEFKRVIDEALAQVSQ